MRSLGLDLGGRTCGVSVSDVLGMIARPVETLRFDEDDYDACFELLQKHLKEFNPSVIVLGLPKHMNGDVGIRGELSIAFKQRLEEAGWKVVLWDERLTTVAAQKILMTLMFHGRKEKK